MVEKSDYSHLKTDKYPEIFIGLIAPVGVNLPNVIRELESELKNYGYNQTSSIKVSDALKTFQVNEKYQNENLEDNLYLRYKAFISEGNDLRAECDLKSVLAFTAIASIRSNRSKVFSDGKAHKIAYIIDQLKTPEEIQVLKHVYGKNFVALAIISDEDSRHSNLKNKMDSQCTPKEGCKYSTSARAEEIIQMDDERNQRDSYNKYAQNVGGCLDSSDYFIEYNEDGCSLSDSVEAFLKRLFKAPYVAPSAEEYGMSVAFNAALRSADMGQQIGCCIATEEGEIVSTGFNEVPCPGGGNYWLNKGSDKRDFSTGSHSLSSIREEYANSATQHIFTQCKEHGIINDKIDNQVIKTKISEAVASSRVKDIIEFGRSVHAEMAALTEASRRGYSVKGATLYTTTYPCHICTVNILSAGVKQVVFLKRYAKSRATRMFDHITLKGDKQESFFRPFKGASPRAYQRFYGTYYESGLKSGDGGVIKIQKIDLPKRANLFMYHNYGLNEKIALYFAQNVWFENGICFNEDIMREVNNSKERVKDVFRRDQGAALKALLDDSRGRFK